MLTEKIKKELSAAANRKMNRCCCICGKKMTAPQEILAMNGQDYCDTCYRDRYFADMDCHHHRVMDHCDG
jgi:hypothetical protein